MPRCRITTQPREGLSFSLVNASSTAETANTGHCG